MQVECCCCWWWWWGWWWWVGVGVGGCGWGLPWDSLLWGSTDSSQMPQLVLIVLFPSSLLDPVVQVSAAGWRVHEDFLFSLGFCQIGSMFGEALGLLIFLLASTILEDFPASLLFLDWTVDSSIPSPGLFVPLVFLGRPTHIFSCFSRLDFSFSQISSVPLPLEFLEIISVMKALWYSNWASGSLRHQVLRRGTNFFLLGEGCQCNSISALTIKPWLGAERLLLVSDLNTNKTTTTITSGLRRLGFYMDHRVTGSCWRDSWA